MKRINFLGFLCLLVVQVKTKDKEKNDLTKFIDECNDPKTTESHIQKNIETLLYAKVILETNHVSNIFLRACENQNLTFCTQCASLCTISQYCSKSGTTSCRTNCISNQVNLLLSNECCSTYCNKKCSSYTHLGHTVSTDRVKRAVAPQPGVTTHPSPSHMISGSDTGRRIWLNGWMWLSGILALFLILTIKMSLRIRKSASYTGSAHQETDPSITVSDSTETDSTDTDSTASGVMLLADKYEGTWDFSDEEIAENFPKAPLDAVLSRQN